jgi:type II secretory pathway pseudopilin PulG
MMQYTQRQAAHTRLDPGEGGFALVASLLTLIVISVLAAAGFVTSQTEVQVSRNHSTSVTAFYVADAALNDYLAVNDTGVVASQGFSYTGGSAVVTATPLVDVDPEATLYLVSAVGSTTMPDGSVSQRTVSKLVLMKTGAPPPGFGKAALTAIGGLEVNGYSGRINGNNQAAAGPGCTPGPATAGVSLPDSSLTLQKDAKADSIFQGDPGIDDEAPDALSLAESLGIDWAGYKDGTALTPDHVLTHPFKNWPDMSNWQVTVVDNTEDWKDAVVLNKNQSGNGVLIIKGDADLMANFVWNGIVLVGGEAEISGNPTVHGNAIVGLNVLTGSAPNDSHIGNGSPNLFWNSCHADRAAALLPPSPPIVAEEPSTWVETF